MTERLKVHRLLTRTIVTGSVNPTEVKVKYVACGKTNVRATRDPKRVTCGICQNLVRHTGFNRGRTL